MTRPVLTCCMSLLLVALAREAALPCNRDDSRRSGENSRDDTPDDNCTDQDTDDSGHRTSPDPLPRVCTNTTHVVGRSECPRFGAWNATRIPRLRLDVGLSSQHISLEGLHASDHRTGTSFRVVNERTEPGGRANGGGFDIRVTSLMGHAMYVGIGLSYGGVSSDYWTVTNDGEAMQLSGGLYASLGAIAGTSIVLGRWQVHYEALLGTRLLTLGAVGRDGNYADIHSLQLQIRPRFMLETWLTPRLTAGAFISTELLHKWDIAAGVLMSLHFRSFDALRSRKK